MASTKSLLLVGVLLAVVILITSEVAALEVQQTKSNGVEDAKYEPSHPGHEGGHGSYPGLEGGHGSYPGQGGGGVGGQGGYCRFGCCRGFRYGHGCKRCCSHATEAPDAFFEDDVKN